MNKTIIFLLIMAVVVIAVVYFFIQGETYKICDGKEDIEGCKRLVSACERMSNYEQKICYSALVIALNDSSVCDKTGKC